MFSGLCLTANLWIVPIRLLLNDPLRLFQTDPLELLRYDPLQPVKTGRCEILCSGPFKLLCYGPLRTRLLNVTQIDFIRLARKVTCNLFNCVLFALLC